MKATLLTCNLSAQKEAPLRSLASQLDLQVRSVPPWQAGHTLAQLLFGVTDPRIPPTPAFAGELLVIAGLPDQVTNLLLQELRRQQVDIPLKAVLTETNSAWTLLQLHGELCRERDAFAAAQAARKR